MATKESKYSILHRKYMTKMSSLFSSRECAPIYAQLSKGKNSYLRMDRMESTAYETEWIDRISDCIYDLGTILKNPKKATKVVTDLVAVELARKTNSTSIQHLASHSQFVKEIKDNGDVIPEKILNIGADDDYATYENRFIATLVRRLVLFVEKRYEYIIKFAPLHNAQILYFKNESEVDGNKVEIETKIKVTELEENSSSAINVGDYIKRIEELRRYIRYYYTSDFMKMLKNERDVRNPILQTNIIRKNPLYNKCFKLYKYIEAYDKIGVNYNVQENYSQLSVDELNEINATLLVNFLTLKGKDPSKEVIVKNKKAYKPKLLSSIDDEIFTYGPLISGPIEFVRVDESFQAYLDTIRKETPENKNMKRFEKEYYAYEVSFNKEAKKNDKERDKLLDRKRKETNKWEKTVAKLITQREKDELFRKALEEARRKELEDIRIEEARKKLREAALSTMSIEDKAKFLEALSLLTPITATPEETIEEAKKITPVNKQEPIENPEELPEIIIEPEEKAEETPIEEVTEEPVEKAEIEETPTEEIEEEFKEGEFTEADVDELESVRRALSEGALDDITEQEEASNEPVEEESVEEQTEEVSEDAPVEEPAIEETPAEEPIDEINEDEAALEEARRALMEEGREDIGESSVSKEQAAEEPAEEVAPVEEEPVEEATAVEVAPEDEETEPVAYEDAVEQPGKEEAKEEAPVEEVSDNENESISTSESIEQSISNEANGEVNETLTSDVDTTPVINIDENIASESTTYVESNVNESSNEIINSDESSKHINVGLDLNENVSSSDNDSLAVNEVGSTSETDVNVASVDVVAGAPLAHKKSKGSKHRLTVKEVEEQKIPGKFIVKTGMGYYVEKGKFSIWKYEAYVFDDFVVANKLKQEFGGKVVKL